MSRAMKASEYTGDNDARATFIGGGDDALHPGNGIDGLLDTAGDIVFHDFRRGASIVGGYHHIGKLDVGIFLDAERAPGEQAQHHERRHQDDGEHRIANTEPGQEHDLAPVGGFGGGETDRGTGAVR
jgi:hypothetical protein